MNMLLLAVGFMTGYLIRGSLAIALDRKRIRLGKLKQGD